MTILNYVSCNIIVDGYDDDNDVRPPKVCLVSPWGGGCYGGGGGGQA